MCNASLHTLVKHLHVSGSWQKMHLIVMQTHCWGKLSRKMRLLHTQVWQALNLVFAQGLGVDSQCDGCWKRNISYFNIWRLEEGDCPSRRNLQGFFPCQSDTAWSIAAGCGWLGHVLVSLNQSSTPTRAQVGDWKCSVQIQAIEHRGNIPHSCACVWGAFSQQHWVRWIL